jgi:hypothetical protein
MYKNRYNTMRAIWAYTRLYGRWTYTEIIIVPPLMNKYGKISIVVVFDVPIIFSGEEHRSRRPLQDFDMLDRQLGAITAHAEGYVSFYLFHATDHFDSCHVLFLCFSLF